MDVTPSSAVEKLGFTQILARLDDLLISEPGRDRLRNIRPAGSVDWLRSELERVTQLQEVLRFDDPVPFEPLPDVREYLRRAAPEDAMLDSSQLFETATHLRTARLVSTYFERRRQRYPALHAVCSHLTPLEAIERAVSDAIEPDGRVRDDASDELRRIRSLISRRQIQLRETIQRELRHAISQGWATEEQPTIRNGRMVIPVRAEAKRKLQGFVQDSSASGQTVYIEPAACLDLNNELRELQGDERREVERILRRLTASLRAHLDDIRQNTRTLAEMDLLQAKARFSNDLGAVAPVLDTDAIIDVHNGRNPVLELHFRRSMSASEARSRVVPLHLQLGGDYRTLIITGPNAGGKTVAMKTVGLFVLMAAHGLP
ncbi:MAG: endonuclease MutS2, partial [Rhodothermales bacterium]